jgi:hypothetical protein
VKEREQEARVRREESDRGTGRENGWKIEKYEKEKLKRGV